MRAAYESKKQSTVLTTLGRRLRVPTSAARSYPPLLPSCTSSCPTGSYLRATTSESRAVRHMPPSRTSLRPTGSRSRAPTAAPQVARLLPPSNTCLCSMDSHSRAPTVSSRGVRPRACFCVQRVAILTQSLQRFELSAQRCCDTKEFSTRQATSPFQAVQRA